MGGDFSLNTGRNGAFREDPSRNLGISYGSFGPWAGAVMQGLGLASTPLSPTGALGLGLQGLTGKSLAGHVGGLLGMGGMNPTQRSGLMPDEMMVGRAGGMSGGGLLDMLGGWGGGAPGNMGMNAGPMG